VGDQIFQARVCVVVVGGSLFESAGRFLKDLKYLIFNRDPAKGYVNVVILADPLVELALHDHAFRRDFPLQFHRSVSGFTEGRSGPSLRR